MPQRGLLLLIPHDTVNEKFLVATVFVNGEDVLQRIMQQMITPKGQNVIIYWKTIILKNYKFQLDNQ